MSDLKDFVIENSILKKYNGEGGDVVIPDCVTSIGSSAFSNCTNLTSVTIPDSVRIIGDWAFNNCDDLTSIAIPSGVKRIGENAFVGCTNLRSITVDENNEYYSSDE